MGMKPRRLPDRWLRASEIREVGWYWVWGPSGHVHPTYISQRATGLWVACQWGPTPSPSDPGTPLIAWLSYARFKRAPMPQDEPEYDRSKRDG